MPNYEAFNKNLNEYNQEIDAETEKFVREQQHRKKCYATALAERYQIPTDEPINPGEPHLSPSLPPQAPREAQSVQPGGHA